MLFVRADRKLPSSNRQLAIDLAYYSGFLIIGFIADGFFLNAIAYGAFYCVILPLDVVCRWGSGISGSLPRLYGS